MHPFLILASITLLGMALRSCRKRCWRKLGALVYLLASGLLVYFLTGIAILGLLTMLAWFFLPWIELSTRVRKLRMPMHNELEEMCAPCLEHFPEARTNIHELEAMDFDHCADFGWDWAASKQHFSFYWHPEERTIITICLCCQSNIAFSYISISSRDRDGIIYRTSNFPFSPTLQNAPNVRLNQIACCFSTLEKALGCHLRFIEKSGGTLDMLLMPDPDLLHIEVEDDMQEQIDYNLKKGYITAVDNTHFRYTFRGLCFLWWQFVKDMVRLS